ncbi:hypothetical protein BD779DRAFT_1477029 [Infundibulicybe gibba]|nr:hypothetical protein BD779DRAFT_1477029 [Infundibulicybe gibba]
MDGEAPERGWAALNPVASSTKEMGPGSQRDTLDDILGDYNWRKITSLFTSILQKAKEAVPLREEHVTAFKAFSAALPPDTITEWTHTMQQWESDPETSENAVRLELAQEEAIAITSRKISIVHEDITPSLLISQGLELEDLQRRLQVDMQNLGAEATDLQRAKVVEDSNRLQRRIDAWIEVQHLYIPQVILRTHMYRSKNKHRNGQSYHTRSLTVIETVQQKIVMNTKRYRENHLALCALSGPLAQTEWENELKPLQDNDIRAPSMAELDDVREGRQTISWIWKVGQVESGSNDIMQQECILLQEEIKRVLAFFAWKAQRWKKLAEYVNPPGIENDDAHEEGCHAYALQQIDNRNLMRSNCKRAWRDLEGWFKMGEGNADEYGFVEVCGSDQIQISTI